jgi:hypothetical protein
MDKRHLDLQYINELKEKSTNDENSFRELLDIQEQGKSSLSEVEYEIEIPLRSYLDKLQTYQDANKTLLYCRELIEEYSNQLERTESKTYTETSLDHITKFDYSGMSRITEPFGKIIQRRLVKQFYWVVLSKVFDKIDSIEIPNISTILENSIQETLKKVKTGGDWLSINMMSLKIIEPLIRELFNKNNWLYQKTVSKNKTLGELLDTTEFRDKYPILCRGLKMMLCDHLGLNVRNNEFHNLNENSSNPYISKVSFVCILSVLSLFKN